MGDEEVVDAEGMYDLYTNYDIDKNMEPDNII